MQVEPGMIQGSQVLWITVSRAPALWFWRTSGIGWTNPSPSLGVPLSLFTGLTELQELVSWLLCIWLLKMKAAKSVSERVSSFLIRRRICQMQGCSSLQLHTNLLSHTLRWGWVFVMVQPPFFPFSSLSVPCPISITFWPHPTSSACLLLPLLQLRGVLMQLCYICTRTSLGLTLDLLGPDPHAKGHCLYTSYNLSDPFFIINNR